MDLQIPERNIVYGDDQRIDLLATAKKLKHRTDARDLLNELLRLQSGHESLCTSCENYETPNCINQEIASLGKTVLKCDCYDPGEGQGDSGPEATQSTPNEAYFDRNQAFQLAAMLAELQGHQVGIAIDPDEGEEWPVLYIDLPTGQVSAHIPRDELNADFLPYPGGWDGSTVKEKRARIYDLLMKTAQIRRSSPPLDFPLDATRSKLYRRAITAWGSEFQNRMFIEEAAEALHAVVKLGRNVNGSTREEVLEELERLKERLEGQGDSGEPWSLCKATHPNCKDNPEGCEICYKESTDDLGAS